MARASVNYTNVHLEGINWSLAYTVVRDRDRATYTPVVFSPLKSAVLMLRHVCLSAYTKQTAHRYTSYSVSWPGSRETGCRE